MSEQDLKSWLNANKLGKILDALNENDIETLDDIKDTLETVEEINDLAQEMKLKTVLKKKFLKAVIKLNHIGQEKPASPPNASQLDMKQTSGMLDTLDKTNIDASQKLNDLKANMQSMKKVMDAASNSDQAGKQQPGANSNHTNEEEKKQTEGGSPQKPQRKKYNLKGVHPVQKLNKLTVGKRHRTIMVIGATGTGKTTLLNSMMNYLWNVEYDDKYRFKLVYETKKKGGDAESVTDNVTAYYLAPPALEYELTVIDTPGFGDTRGLEQDQKITKQIKKFFEEKIQEIDAICFVIRAPQARLTATQKYIFAQVLGIFGNDIADNILILMTFADGKKPPALAALKAGSVPYKSHFKLNNSAFDLPEEGEEEDMFSQMFWKMGIASFEKLFKSIGELKTKSLQLTKKVLSRREELECYIESVQPTIRNGFSVLDTLRQQIVAIQKYGDLMNANEDFEYEAEVNKAKQVPNHGAFNTTTCLECNYTCHRSCVFSDNADKARCSAMGSDGYCVCCKDRCHWSMHKNVPYTVEWYTEKVMKTTQELKDKYYDASSKKSVEEQVMAGSVAELAQVEEDLNGLINNVRKCLNELGKIALRPNVLSQDDYIDKLIQSEEAERKRGYQKRIAALRQLKEKQDMLSKLNSDKYDPWKQYQDVQQFIGQNQNIKKKVNKKVKGKNKKKKGGWFGSSWW